MLIPKNKTEWIAAGVGTGIVIFGGIWLYNKVKRGSTNIKTKKSATGYSKNTVGNINITETARQLGLDLGYAYASYDPRHWTENDDAILETMKAVPKDLMPKLVIEYFKLYKRNLQQDLQEKLDDYDQIRDKFL